MDESLKPGRVHIREKVIITGNGGQEAKFHERFRAHEQKGLTTMNGCKMFMRDAGEALEKRMKKMGIWWRYQGLCRQYEQMCYEVELTAEPEQYATLVLRGSTTMAYIGVERVSSSHDGGTYVMTDNLNVICRKVLEDTCSFCQKKGAEAEKCPLQAALKACTTLPDDTKIDGCMFKPYSDAAYLGLIEEEEGVDI